MIGYLINFEFTTSIKLQRSDPLKKHTEVQTRHISEYLTIREIVKLKNVNYN